MFVVRENRVERRAVTVGAGATATRSKIVSGLNAGERIVVEGVSTLADGARVQER